MEYNGRICSFNDGICNTLFHSPRGSYNFPLSKVVQKNSRRDQSCYDETTSWGNYMIFLLIISVVSAQNFSSNGCYGTMSEYTLAPNSVQNIQFSLPMTTGVKYCANFNYLALSSCILEVTILSSNIVHSAQYMGTTYNWDGILLYYDGTNNTQCSCHCPLGNGNWALDCAEAGGSGVILQTGETHASFCYVSQQSGRSSGCAFGGYQTSWTNKIKGNLYPRDVYMTDGWSNQNVTARICAYSGLGVPLTCSNVNLATEGPTFFQIGNQILTLSPSTPSRVYDPDLSNVYFSFKTNTHTAANLLRIPEEYVDLSTATAEKIGSVLVDPLGRLRYQGSVFMEKHVATSGMYQCYHSRCTSTFDLGSILSFENDPSFIASNGLELNGITPIANAIEIMVQNVGSFQGLIRFTNLSYANDIYANTTSISPVISQIVCQPYNQFFPETTCNMTYSTVTNILAQVASNSLNVDQVFLTAPSGVVKITVPASSTANGTTSLCFINPQAGLLGTWASVCYAANLPYTPAEVNPDETPDTDDGSSEDGADADNAGDTVNNSYSTLQWYWILLIVVLVLLVMIPVGIVVGRCLMRWWKEKTPYWNKQKEYRKLLAEKKTKKDMEEMDMELNQGKKGSSIKISDLSDEF